MHILVLHGGESNERDISLRSSEHIVRALKENGHTVITYDTHEGLEGISELLPGIDVVFPVLHGRGGEDGSVQELLESYRIPFIGADSAASRLCFDKVTTKQTLETYGIPTPKWAEVTTKSFIESPLSQSPYVLKPRDGGSSIDTSIVRIPSTQSADMNLFLKYKTLLLEELISGTELTVSILGSEALPVVEIIPPEGKEFDYDNKYNGATRELCPPQHVSVPIQEQAQSLAEQVHQVCGARHYSRVDFMMAKNGELYVLEINTIPGMTKESLYPKAAAAAGITMNDLVERLIDMALHGNEGHY